LYINNEKRVHRSHNLPRKRGKEKKIKLERACVLEEAKREGGRKGGRERGREKW